MFERKISLKNILLKIQNASLKKHFSYKHLVRIYERLERPGFHNPV